MSLLQCAVKDRSSAVHKRWCYSFCVPLLASAGWLHTCIISTEVYFLPWCASTLIWMFSPFRVFCYQFFIHFRIPLIQLLITLEILVVWQLRKIVPRTKVLPSITSGMYAYSMTLYCVTCIFWDPFAVIITSKDPKKGKQGTAGERKHVTLMIP